MEKSWDEEKMVDYCYVTLPDETVDKLLHLINNDTRFSECVDEGDVIAKLIELYGGKQ